MKRGLFLLGVFLGIIVILLSIFVYADQTNGNVYFEILAEPQVFIWSPVNSTYGFYLDQDIILFLNVSANFVTDTWWYSLYDLENNLIVNDSVIFVPEPGKTIEGVEGQNKLQVFANDTLGNTYHSNVSFSVLTESSPILGYIDNPIYACENESLIYLINATDVDSEELEFSLSPRTPFFIDPNYQSVSVINNVSYSRIISLMLEKSYVGNHTRTIYVQDPTDLVDFFTTRIEVIPINNPPEVERLGVKTIYTHGDNSSFYKIVQVNDLEDGDQTSENIFFELNFYENDSLFNITNSGLINYTGKEEDIGNYIVGLCVEDSGLSQTHPMIDMCDGDSSFLRVCQNFSLTVTNENRPPEIITHYPDNTKKITIYEGDYVYFNITKYDPDGNVPESYWFVDDNFKEYYGFENSVDEFYYTFSLGSAGEHFVIVTVSDGIENVSMRWNITVLEAEADRPSGGSSGIRAPPPPPEEECISEWVCDFWQDCRLVDVGVLEKEISKEETRALRYMCSLNSFDNKTCGFTTRECFDINECGGDEEKPLDLDVCEFFEEPSCYDGRRNCHSGSCEVGVDCGGPCAHCPSCSDGIRNQGELGIDCGGPCPWKCETEVSLFSRLDMLYILIITLLLLIAAVIVRIIKIVREIREE